MIPSSVTPTSALTIRVETAWLPPFTVGVGALEATAAGPALAVRVLKPRITISSGSVKLGVVEPAGPPGTSKWPILAVGLAIVGGGILLRLFR